MIKTDRDLTLEAERLQQRIREVRQARIDELWPTYYSAQIALARNSMDAMTKVLKCRGIEKAKNIARAEVAALIKFIDELEKENEGRDTIIEL